ncbi:MAG: 50S ribosomal protein L25/general stress protein Ctc [Bacteroidetes bacterium]|nr:50S ribosomal protein L25/general stress protein Ctc [Bacteroidota bacterium]MBL6942802.1 50S ribosomal protein L25/general stress protein Ctc [Bacteroidales bacterium]
MKKVSLSGSLRENVGKKDAKKHRREGNIPCVIYGGEKQVHFVTNEIKFDKIIFSPDVFLLSISIDGKEYQTILQDIQYHPVTDKVLHADFMELTPGKAISIGIPVNLAGISPGVIAGGQLIKKMHKIRVKGLVDVLPENIDVDISKLVIGGSIKIRDIELDNLALLDPPNSVIVRVKTSRTVTEDLEEDEEGEEGEEGEEAGEEGTAPGAKEE